jgi:ABC-type Fe3+/spermidine/putrescine transport system ATPase subunit
MSAAGARTVYYRPETQRHRDTVGRGAVRVPEQVATIRPSTVVNGLAAESAHEPVLQLRQLSKLFNGQLVVDQIDLTIRRGEFFTLLGPSGCGKTTTLRMVAGLERPDSGEIVLRGRAVASAATRHFDPPEKRNLGMVFQSYAIWPHMTVFENVAYPLDLRGHPRATIRARVAEVLELVGLSGLEQRPATQLSGGQQQRLALCRALVYEPDLILLDEPFSNLDAKLREQMRIELKLLQQRLNVTVLFVTHDQLEALSLSDTIAVMNLGRLEQVGTPRTLYDRPRSPFVRDFIGQNVLLNGHVREVLENRRAVVGVDGLVSDATVVGSLATDWQPQPGTAVTLAVRPEDIELVAPGTLREGSVLPALARSALFLGDRYQVGVVLPNGTDLVLQASRRNTAWRPDQQVSVCLPAEAVSVWPA